LEAPHRPCGRTQGALASAARHLRGNKEPRDPQQGSLSLIREVPTSWNGVHHYEAGYADADPGVRTPERGVTHNASGGTQINAGHTEVARRVHYIDAGGAEFASGVHQIESEGAEIEQGVPGQRLRITIGNSGVHDPRIGVYIRRGNFAPVNKMAKSEKVEGPTTIARAPGRDSPRPRPRQPAPPAAIARAPRRDSSRPRPRWPAPPTTIARARGHGSPVPLPTTSRAPGHDSPSPRPRSSLPTAAIRGEPFSP
jgi:hypothetical protein